MHFSFHKKMTLTLKGSIFLIFFCSLCITGFLFYIAPGSLLYFLKGLAKTPLLFFLNYIPILLMMGFVFVLTNRSVFSVTLVSVFLGILGIANRMKIQMRQDPLLPTDLTLYRETITILKSFQPIFLILLIVGLLLAILLLVATFFFLKGTAIKPQFRFLAFVVLLVVSFGMNHFYYKSNGMYDRFPVDGNIYFQVNHYNSKGLVYCFLHNINTLKVQKPEGYSSSTYGQMETSPKKDYSNKEKPHIIMIMGEAYSDLSENENLDFSKSVDPMLAYKALAKKDGAISGHLVVPNFGGGTSDTEYDVLTACPTRYLENTLPSYNFVRKSFDGLPRRLEEIDYDSLAIHPGYSWFYNRQNVYPALGFQDTIFLDAFDPNLHSKGGYINEAITTDTIIDRFEQHLESSENPFFSFTVTIQNHGPYESKYGPIEQNFDSKIPLSDAENNILNNYFEGMQDADQEIARLTKYAEESEEPIVLVYFGDHLPGFSNGMAFFDLLDYDIDINGSPEERLRVYETPYVIWQNDAAKAVAPFDETLLQEDTSLISSNYLGAYVMELLGMGDISPLFTYSNQLRKELPIMGSTIFVDDKKNYLDTLPAALQNKVNTLKGWQYYKLFDENITTK